MIKLKKEITQESKDTYAFATDVLDVRSVLRLLDRLVAVVTVSVVVGLRSFRAALGCCCGGNGACAGTGGNGGGSCCCCCCGDGALGGFISIFLGSTTCSRSKTSGTIFLSTPSLILNGLIAIFGLDSTIDDDDGFRCSSLSSSRSFISFCTSATTAFCTSSGLVSDGGSIVFCFLSDSFALAVSCAFSISNSFSSESTGSGWNSDGVCDSLSDSPPDRSSDG